MKKNLQLPPERSLGNQVRRCHRMFDRALSAHLAPHDLNTGFWYYLRALWAQDGLTQRQLSDITNVTESTTVTVIEMMRKRGLVIRNRDPLDRRKLRVSLTSRGQSLREDLMPYAFQINAIAAAGIPRGEIDTCLSVLMRMSANLQQHGAAPAATRRSKAKRTTSARSTKDQ